LVKTQHQQNIHEISKNSDREGVFEVERKALASNQIRGLPTREGAVRKKRGEAEAIELVGGQKLEQPSTKEIYPVVNIR